ncbi:MULTISPECIES: DUF916 and DUF3324 domain-containing protein [Enterococcus]|uniref:DUF916 and DUF3324 domain-containing protein n=1 Tax=Enterococcus TaxID=1350 RepID=UPI001F5C409C|nr:MULTISPECIES: DUF916 and DUF3324 domain-containing protein [Enterococcus]
MKFSVEPVIPENQKDTGHTYFDLNMTPKQKQKLKVHMRNDTEKEVIVKPSVHAGTTNINGVVEYGESNTKVDDTVQYNIEDIVKPTVDEVKIPAKGSNDLELDIQMPEGKFKGILAGGITLEEKEENKKEEKDKAQGLAIENKYAYVVAVVLHESDEKVESELKLTEVKPGQVNARNVINATIQNTQPKYMNQLSVNTKITKKGKKDVLYSSKNEGMQMAPKSSFSYPVSLNGEKLRPGKYTLDMYANSMKKEWHFVQDFEIKADVAKKLNETDVSVKKNDMWIYILIGVLFLLIIILIVILLKKKKREKKEAERQMKKSKKRKVKHK